MSKQWDIEKVRNIGISAHIDSGKTTLTERILFYTDRIHAIHDVRGKDGVGAKMDSMELEKERGITIQSAATNVNWKSYHVNIIDTPGHVDFTIEVERSLRVLDGAILVLCGVAGVQSQSFTVDRQMRRYKVPRIAFINKLDRAGANPFRVCKMLKEKLNHNAVLMQIPIGLEEKHEGVIDLVTMKAIYFEGTEGEKPVNKDIPEELKDQAMEYRLKMIEALSDFDDVLAEKFLNEEDPNEEEIRVATRKATLSLNITPVFMGSAFKNKGVQSVLDAVIDYLPNPQEVENKALNQTENEKEVILSPDPTKPFVGLAFKLDDTRFGQLTYMRLYQGTVKKGDFIYNIRTGKKLKVPRIVYMHADEKEDIDSSSGGDIVAFFGVDCSSGDTFCSEDVQYTMTSMFVPNAVISMAVEPKERNATGNFSKALQKFTREDPTFRVHRDEESAQTVISGMGELHLNIYIERMKREFKCEVNVGQPQVAYRETITKSVKYEYTHKKQSGGAGQFAKVVGTFNPLPVDEEKHYEFKSKITGGRIPKEYIPAVDKGFQEQMKKGPLVGFPIVGVEAILSDGAYHDVDSSELAFKICAMTAFREHFSKAKPAVLEPIMKLEVSAPDEFQGNVIGQINQRRGMIKNTTSQSKFVTIEAEVPLAEMFNYSTELRSATQGKGEFTMEFAYYSQVPRNIQEELIKQYIEKEKKGEKSMILSDGGIQSRLESKELRIDPLDKSCIQPASVDLKLGKQFIIIKHWGGDILDFNSKPNYHSIEADEFLVPSHSFVLATTVECLRLPHDLTAFVEGRSSVGRMGLFIQNAGWVDPGFEGQLTLELYNANSLPIRLHSERRICQIVFCKMDQKTKQPYKGKYQGQKGATGTRIFMDQENSAK